MIETFEFCVIELNEISKQLFEFTFMERMPVIQFQRI